MDNTQKFEGEKNPDAENSSETTFEKVSRRIADRGLDFHGKEHDESGRDPKTYHTSEHPRVLESRAKQMAEALELSPKQYALADMAIAWHDTVINYDRADQNEILSMVRRHRGARAGDKPKGADGNEGASAGLLEEQMRDENKISNSKIFTEEDIRIARWAIDATYPDVNLGSDFKGAVFEEYPYYGAAISQNPELGKFMEELKGEGIIKGPMFFQPHIEMPMERGEKVPKEVLVVAFSDLGAAGLGEEVVFLREGDDEMRELYANLRRPEVMSRLINGNEEEDIKDRERVSGAFFAWLKNQPGFAIWQALRFEKILCLMRRQDDITRNQELKLRAQFCHFIDNSRASLKRSRIMEAEFNGIKSERQDKESFAYLAKNTGYAI